MPTWRNWAGNQRGRPTSVARPRTEADVADLVARVASAGGRLRPVGSGHSFSGVAATEASAIDLSHLHGVEHVDAATGVATIAAGTTLAAASDQLARAGRAFENLGDIAAQTMAGATATGTHGTGVRFGNLSSTVVGARIVTGSGEVVDLDADRDPETLRAVRIHLGALGVVTSVRVRTVPSFRLHARESIEEVGDVLADLDRFVDGNDHAELLWFPGSAAGRHELGLALVKRNGRITDGAEGEGTHHRADGLEGGVAGGPRGRLEAFVGDELVSNTLYGAMVRVSDHLPRATRGIHAVLRRLPDTVYTDRSDRVFATPRRVRFVEMEQSVPREAFVEAFARIRRIYADLGRDVPFPVECRWVAGDDADLSPTHDGPRAYLAVHLSPRRHDARFFAAVEEALADLGARPHWGKLHGLTARELAPRYRRWDAFQEVRRRFDPAGTFGSDHLDRVLGPAGVQVRP